MNEKVTGYILLIVGIAIMLFSVINIYLIFSKELTSLKDTSNYSASGNTPVLGDIQKNLLNASGSINTNSLFSNFIPPQTINQTLIVTVEFFLFSFLLSFGYKISSLGVLLIRPINVKLKSDILPFSKNDQYIEN